MRLSGRVSLLHKVVHANASLCSRWAGDVAGPGHALRGVGPHRGLCGCRSVRPLSGTLGVGRSLCSRCPSAR
eukprot:14227062-Alexandrium_andersonii.AAC.1